MSAYIKVHSVKSLLVESYPTASPFLVLTQTIGRLSKKWTVTHVPSGLAVMTFIRTKKRAHEVVERLLLLPIDWGMTGEKIQKKFSNKFRNELNEIRDFGLGK